MSCTRASCVWLASLLLGSALPQRPGGEQAAASEPATARLALDDAVDNWAAFARAFGFVRYFHPSDQGASANWDELATRGAVKVAVAASSRELADSLRDLFAPVAPSARFLVEGEPVARLAPPEGAVQIARWRHRGFGIGQRPELAQIYCSERERRPALPPASDWAAPTDPVVLDLGRGVRLALPVVLWADAAGKTLPAKAPPLEDGTSTRGGAAERERSARIAAVAVAWTAVRHFFPNFEEVAVDWEAELSTALRRAATDRTKQGFLVTLRRMMAALQDGHAGAFLDEAPPDLAPPVALTLLGGKAIVVKAWGPVAKALPPGSAILAIDGEAAPSRIALTAAQVSAASAGWRDTCVARELLAGAPGSTVFVVARLPGGRERKLALARPASVETALRPPRSPPAREVRSGVWYVHLSKVSHADLEALLPKLAQAKAVVFDLRWYPSEVAPSFLQHLLERPAMSPRWEVPVLTDPARASLEWNEAERWSLEPVAPRINGKIAFLSGNGAISYGETLLDIVDAYKLGIIVGEASAGSNGTAVEAKLPGGFSVSWTGMRVRRRDGSRLFGLGIPPTIPAVPTLEGIAANRDEVLERAIDALEIGDGGAAPSSSPHFR